MEVLFFAIISFSAFLLMGGVFLFYARKYKYVSVEEFENLRQIYEEKKSEAAVLMEKTGSLSLLNSNLKSEVEKLREDKEKVSVSLASESGSLKLKIEEANKYSEECEILKKKLEYLQSELVKQTEFNKYLNEKLETNKTDLEKIGKIFTDEFKLLANSILEDKSKRFTEMNLEGISGILKPLGENIEQFKKKVEETYDKESKQRFSLEDRIKELVHLNSQISIDANNLTKALKGEAKTQGDWGEMILENILQASGLTKNREYFIQEYIKDDSGKILHNEKGEKLRPDVIVHYPDNKKIVIDSKVSLVGYEKFCSEKDPIVQKKYLDEHVRSVRQHIEQLSGKNYQNHLESLDFVIMFMPVEPAYLTAMQADNSLWKDAYDKKILLISPTNLIAALKIIAELWKQENRNRNAREIAKQSGNLYDKFVAFTDELLELGRHIERTQKSYDSALNKLSEGKGNLISRAQKLKKLGIDSSKSIQTGLLKNFENTGDNETQEDDDI